MKNTERSYTKYGCSIALHLRDSQSSVPTNDQPGDLYTSLNFGVHPFDGGIGVYSPLHPASTIDKRASILYAGIISLIRRFVNRFSRKKIINLIRCFGKLFMHHLQKKTIRKRIVF